MVKLHSFKFKPIGNLDPKCSLSVKGDFSNFMLTSEILLKDIFSPKMKKVNQCAREKRPPCD